MIEKLLWQIWCPAEVSSMHWRLWCEIFCHQPITTVATGLIPSRALSLVIGCQSTPILNGFPWVLKILRLHPKIWLLPITLPSGSSCSPGQLTRHSTTAPWHLVCNWHVVHTHFNIFVGFLSPYLPNIGKEFPMSIQKTEYKFLVHLKVKKIKSKQS